MLRRGICFGAGLLELTMVCALSAMTVFTHVFSSVATAANEAPDDLTAEGTVSPIRSGAISIPDPALKLDYSANPIALEIALPSTNVPKRSGMVYQRWPLLVAFHRDMPNEFQGDLSPQLDWTELKDDSIVTSISVTSPEASDIRLGIHITLAKGGEIRFFAPESNQVFPAIEAMDLLPDSDTKPRLLWSPVVEGDTIGVEIMLPSTQALSTFSFHVDRVSHGYMDKIEPSATDLSLECPERHIEAACRKDRTGLGMLNAVARIRYESWAGGGFCTGTLITNRIGGTFIPFFLTANHCVSTQEEADSIAAEFFFRRSGCGVSDLLPTEATSGGAELLATSQPQDSTLLRFRGRMPGGLNFVGWTTRPIVSSLVRQAAVFNLSHPRSTPLKFAAGNVTGRENIRLRNTDITVRSAYRVHWEEGATEPGSSGSGLFLDNSVFLVGVASASDDRCGSPSFWGAFRDF